MGYTIALTGDSIIARPVSQYQDEPTQKLYSLIRESDVSFTNIEVVASDFVGDPAARSDGAHFGVASSNLDELQEIGFNLFSSANNHALDYGVKGLLTAIDNMKQRKMHFSGVGKNLAEARMPVYLTTDNVTVALISCSSTFFDEQAAGEQRNHLQGRPGLNPLRFEVEYIVKPSQFEVLKEIHEELGLKGQQEKFAKLGFDREVIKEGVLKFSDSNHRVIGSLNAKFKEGPKTTIQSRANPKDLAEINAWVAEAKERADIVIVSIHAHEEFEVREKADHYIHEFSRSVIDHGADIVVGHGPHLLRGIELYNNKPIFYSLGNFIGQNELIEQLPEDSYRRFNVPSNILPSELFNIRCDYGKKGFPGDPVFWISVMPYLVYEENQIKEIRLYPLELTKGEKGYQRGRPMLASEGKSEVVYKILSELSLDYGTKIIKENSEFFTIRL
ncbi:CapA family protein [Ureibacillus manganicus]|uniref:Poly-gamma-glutamate biosynthesis protein n=1 Tax=Ureibacillus manganicus DSM 26584 TaxID=1384049 RepID=A0A0A3ITC3_9BACL|nr:CapA family protein [Ureibacillus manganicus]KGR78072.1 poly-gamma-glutamate biosynthesis protein [Ureibacillus manganicus DSM 26584]